MSQLELVKEDREPYIQDIPTLETFKTSKVTSLMRDVDYHTKNIDETEERERERFLAYQRIRSEVEEILGQSPSSASKEVD